ncbi:MAG: prephenate dehydrogenase [Treponema sp.]|jgi:prephenate dehydrogenase|nr:prephenate dehydrogenase [Treponema sp.]
MQKNVSDCNIGIAGLGLMGGAIARALRDKCGVTRLFACDKDNKTLEAARQEGLIDKGFDAANAGEMLALCDIVFLCLNPSLIPGFLEQWKNTFKKGCLVTDIAGTKESIAEAAQKFCEERKSDCLDFIPGHPMAGAEKSGFSNSQLCNFNGKNYILTPLSCNKPQNIELLKNLIYSMGFSRITQVTPAEHDRKIAFTSQLCHVIAAALIDCESDTEITRFGGGSFEDLTRIAMLNAPMWTELFIENRVSLLDRIDQFEKSLEELKTLINNSQSDKLEEKLAAIRDRRIAMSSVQK